MPRKGKNVYAQYSKDTLAKAVDAVKNGMSYRKASEVYNIPKTTIRDRITGRISEDATLGRKPTFPIEVEAHLADNVKQAAAKGFGISRMQLASKAALIANRLKVRTPFKDNIPGKDWVNAFKQRHNLSTKRPVPLSTTRSRLLNPVVTTNYFNDLEILINKLNLLDQPSKIWNMDETNSPLTHKPTRILAERGAPNTPGRVGNCREGITVVACINAGGKHVPPLCIVKGKTQKSLQAYNVTRGPEGAKYTYQSRAWMEDVLGEIWFKEHFLRHCGPERP